MTQKSNGVAICVGISGNPTVKEELTGCTEAITGLVKECEATGAKGKFSKLTVDVGQKELLTIVTNLDCISVGSRIVVACVGSFAGGKEVKKTTVADIVSEGLVCDTAMLGWKGGAAGCVALLPASFDPGEPAPEEKPRRGDTALVDAAGNSLAAAVNDEIAVKKVLSKEEKKAEAAAKKAAREAKKKGEPPPGGGYGDGADEVVVKNLPKAPTKELKRIKKLAADKRKKGEEVWTDDELEAAGFAIQGVE